MPQPWTPTRDRCGPGRHALGAHGGVAQLSRRLRPPRSPRATPCTSRPGLRRVLTGDGGVDRSACTHLAMPGTRLAHAWHTHSHACTHTHAHIHTCTHLAHAWHTHACMHSHSHIHTHVLTHISHTLALTRTHSHSHTHVLAHGSHTRAWTGPGWRHTRAGCQVPPTRPPASRSFCAQCWPE